MHTVPLFQHLSIAHSLIHSLCLSAVSTCARLVNFLLKVLDEKVKHYIQDQLNAVIDEQSSKLLASLNELSVDYLPLLEKILGKAEKVVIKKTGKKTLMGAITGNEEEEAEGGKEEADGRSQSNSVEAADKKPVV